MSEKDKPFRWNTEDATAAADKELDIKEPLWGHVWRDYKALTLADIARGKAQRVSRAIVRDDIEHALSETVDFINYGRFLWVKLKEAQGE